MLFGTQNGSVVNHLPMDLAANMADARMDGMKLIVVDPVGINAGSKANEWIPIRPGTDTAPALAMINVLLNEEEIYDREFLGKFTNGPYLIRSDGRYLRDQNSGKPLAWDLSRGEAIAFDDPGIAQMALEGRYSINGEEMADRCRSPGSARKKGSIGSRKMVSSSAVGKPSKKHTRGFFSRRGSHFISSTFLTRGKR